jgi:hypothetical protein
MKKLLFALILILPVWQASAQPTEQLERVSVVPDADSWQRMVGDPTRFHITVMKDGAPMRNARIAYQVGPERMKPPLQQLRLPCREGRGSFEGASACPGCQGRSQIPDVSVRHCGHWSHMCTFMESLS